MSTKPLKQGKPKVSEEPKKEEGLFDGVVSFFKEMDSEFGLVFDPPKETAVETDDSDEEEHKANGNPSNVTINFGNLFGKSKSRTVATTVTEKKGEATGKQDEEQK